MQRNYEHEKSFLFVSVLVSALARSTLVSLVSTQLAHQTGHMEMEDINNLLASVIKIMLVRLGDES